MRSFVVTDYDGCLIRKHEPADAPILDQIARILRSIQSRIPVIIVSARASKRAIESAQQALFQANLAHVPFLYRNMEIHDNSPAGVVTAKESAIRDYMEIHGAIPLLGIGDEDTDVQVYRQHHMTIVRLDWAAGAVNTQEAAYYYPVTSKNFLSIWDRIFADITALIA